MSDAGPDVIVPVTRTPITTEWGTSVANDLAELHATKLGGEHLADPVGAHDATAITFAPTETVTATDVQTAIEQASALAGAPGPPGADSTVPGPAGPAGAQGTPGVGVPTGGAVGQVLGKTGVGDYLTGWVEAAAGGGVADGDKGDITVGSGGTVWLFDTSVVTAAAKTVLDDVSTTAMRTTLGLGNVDNTSDVDKPVSTATQTALNAKQPLDTELTDLASKWVLPSPTLPSNLIFTEATNDGTNTCVLYGPSLLGSNVTVSLPNSTTLLVGDNTTGTLTNKSMSGVTNTFTNIPHGALKYTIEAVAGTTYAVVAADAGKLKSMTGTATITLPSGELAAGQSVDFVCVGGAATFTLGGGATWHVAPTPSAVARAVGSFVSAVKMGATTWALTGDLA